MSETATTNLNLYQKLAKIRMIADVAAKDKRGFNYSYADITQILAKVTAGMNKYGVSLIPGIVHESFDVQKVEIRNVEIVKDKYFIWGYSTSSDAPVFKRMRKAEFMAKRRWKKYRKGTTCKDCPV